MLLLTVANEIVALPHSENVNFGVSVGIIKNPPSIEKGELLEALWL